MNKFHILLILLFGFLLMPSNSFACENNSSKHSSAKETSSKMNKEDCCKNEKNHEGCGGKCNHSKCGCATSCNSCTVAMNELKFNNNLFNFSSEKQNFHNYETNISAGFYSLWLIPKIG